MLRKRDGGLRSAGLHYTTFSKRSEPFIETNNSCILFHPFPSEVVMYFWARVHLCMYVWVYLCMFFVPPPTFCDRTRLLGLPAALTSHLKASRSLTQHSQWCLQPPCGNVGNYVTHLLAATWTADVYMAYRFPVILSPQSGNDSEDLYQQPTEEIKLLIQTRAYTVFVCTWKILM